MVKSHFNNGVYKGRYSILDVGYRSIRAEVVIQAVSFGGFCLFFSLRAWFEIAICFEYE